MLEEIKKSFDKLLNSNNITEAQKQELKKLKEQQELELKVEQEEKDRRLKMDNITVSTFELLTDHLKSEKIKEQTPHTKDEIVTLNIGGFDFDTQGYKYSYLIVGDYDAGTILTLDYLGTRYTQILKSGINQIDAMPNTRLSANKTVQFILVRSDEEKQVHKKEPVILETVNGTGNKNYTFKQYCTGFVITNDDATSDLTIQINGITITVKAGEVFEGDFSKFNNVVITAVGSYRAYGRG
jgi:hypothetical protein